MARRKINIDDKIEQQKLVVSKAKDRYEAELEQLNQLIKKRDELHNKFIRKFTLKKGPQQVGQTLKNFDYPLKLSLNILNINPYILGF